MTGAMNVMMTERKVRKINNLIYKLYKSYWQDNQDVYAEIQSINYSVVDSALETLELEIAWGNNTQDHHYRCTVFVHDYLKSARDIAIYIMAMIDSKEI